MDVRKLNDAAAVAVAYLFDDALQGNAAEVVVDGFVQSLPKIVRHAGRAVVAVGFADAMGCVQPIFGGGDDFSDVDACRRGGEDVAATRPAQAFNKSGAAEFAEQLLEIRQDMFGRSLMALSLTAPVCAFIAKSSIAVTAKRPLVINLMVVVARVGFFISGWNCPISECFSQA